MEISGISPKIEMPKPDAAGTDTPQKLENSGDKLADEMKDVRKARLQRQVMADPSLAGKLVATEASPTYNAKGSMIQAVSASLGEA